MHRDAKSMDTVVVLARQRHVSVHLRDWWSTAPVSQALYAHLKGRGELDSVGGAWPQELITLYQQVVPATWMIYCCHIAFGMKAWYKVIGTQRQTENLALVWLWDRCHEGNFKTDTARRRVVVTFFEHVLSGRISDYPTIIPLFGAEPVAEGALVTTAVSSS